MVPVVVGGRGEPQPLDDGVEAQRGQQAEGAGEGVDVVVVWALLGGVLVLPRVLLRRLRQQRLRRARALPRGGAGVGAGAAALASEAVVL